MADLQTIFYQIVLSIMRESKFSSASPGHTNTFIGVTGANTSIGTDEELRQAIMDIIESVESIPEGAEKPASKILGDTKKKEKQVAAGITSTISKVQNPASIVASGLPLLPHAALIALAIALSPIIFDILTKPGGPLDLRFKRIIDDEINAFLSRQTQKDTEMGIRQVIIQSKTGFTAANGKNNYNTVRGIREGGLDKERLDRIGMVDHSKGVFD